MYKRQQGPVGFLHHNRASRFGIGFLELAEQRRREHHVPQRIEPEDDDGERPLVRHPHDGVALEVSAPEYCQQRGKTNGKEQWWQHGSFQAENAEVAVSGALVAADLAMSLVVLTPPTSGMISTRPVSYTHLIAGDTLFAGSIGRTDLPGGSYQKIMESLHGPCLLYTSRCV